MQTPTEEQKALQLRLCRKIAKIDYFAANWVLYEAPALDTFSYTDNLQTCFSWEYTPQGYDFWLKMFTELGKTNQQTLSKPTTSNTPATDTIPLTHAVELWWQREHRLASAQREEVFALRNAIRKICGQEHY